MTQPLRAWPAWVGVITLLAPVAVADAWGTQTPAPPSDNKTIVLQTLHAGSVALDLTMLPCHEHACPIQVRLIEGARVVDHVTLPIPASSQYIKGEAVDDDWGADPGLRAWRSGFEGDYVATAARLVTLAPQTPAVLVTQRQGFDPVKREHVIVLLRHGRLRMVWKAPDAPGAWSQTLVLSGSVAYFRGVRDLGEGHVDRLDAFRLRWDSATGRMRATPLPDRHMPLYLMEAGGYASTGEAREGFSSQSFCLAPYWVLDASAFPLPSRAVVLIGKLYTRRSLAEAAAEQVKTCLPSFEPTVVKWTAAP